MRAGGAKDKGSSFERDVSQILSRWISHGKEEDIFWKSQSSGAVSTTAGKSGADLPLLTGDITAAKPEAIQFLRIFVVECKHYADLHLQDLAFQRESNIAIFWRQVCRDAARAKRLPFLVARQNRKPTLCGIVPGVVEVLRTGLGVDLPPGLLSERYYLHLFELTPFLAAVQPEGLSKIGDSVVHTISANLRSRL